MGGNVKVGDVHATPIKVTEHTRGDVAHDIHHMLSAVHDSLHAEHGIHLFGKDKKALNTHSAFSGSSAHLYNKSIPDKEFAKHKPKMGDVDVQIPHKHAVKLGDHLTKGKKFGKYSVAGVSRHGLETTALMKHKDSGETHQVDFEHVDYHKDEPTKGDQLIHNSHWDDTKAGIKGEHHKSLINSAGGEKTKFSNSHGLRSRKDESDPGTKEPEEITKKLFGAKADASHITSFHGVTRLIKKHIPAAKHQAIYDKFKEGTLKKKHTDSSKALSHLRTELGVRDKSIAESIVEAVSSARAKASGASDEVHHASVIPLVGFSPISHMGHAKDLGAAMKELPGQKHIGISSKADVFSAKERGDILTRQWKQPDITHHASTSGGATVAAAFHALPKHGKKVLHMLVGSDRVDMAHGLKNALERGKIKEMGAHKWDAIHVHTPQDADRSHGMSGTKMRTAASSGDDKTFAKHLGPMFNPKETARIQKKVHSAIKSGDLAVKR